MKLPQTIWKAVYEILKDIGRARARRAQGMWY